MRLTLKATYVKHRLCTTKITEMSRLKEKKDYSMRRAHQRNVQNQYQRGGKEQQPAFFIAFARPFGCRVERSRVGAYRRCVLGLGSLTLSELGHTCTSDRWWHQPARWGQRSAVLWRVTNFDVYWFRRHRETARYGARCTKISCNA